MSALLNRNDSGAFTVVHPLDDHPEQKCNDALLDQMKMSWPVRISLFALRGYLVAMVGLVVYRLLEITIFTHH